MHGNFADVITRDKFFVDLFRGFRVLRLPMFLFYIGLAGRSYDSVSTIPCYTVITSHFCVPMPINCPVFTGKQEKVTAAKLP